MHRSSLPCGQACQRRFAVGALPGGLTRATYQLLPQTQLNGGGSKCVRHIRAYKDGRDPQLTPAANGVITGNTGSSTSPAVGGAPLPTLPLQVQAQALQVCKSLLASYEAAGSIPLQHTTDAISRLLDDGGVTVLADGVTTYTDTVYGACTAARTLQCTTAVVYGILASIESKCYHIYVDGILACQKDCM